MTFNSYRRENITPNRFKFQGQEHIDDISLGWDSFKWRNHQPDIGRFFNIDPLSDKYVYNSPYAFSENHVTSHVELEGLEKVDFRAAQFEAHEKGKTTVVDNQVRRDNNVYNRDFSESPNGGDYKELQTNVETSNGTFSKVNLNETGESVAEEMFDGAVFGDIDHFSYDISGQATESGSIISGNIEGAEFNVEIKIVDGVMTFNTTLSGGDASKGFVLTTGNLPAGNTFSIGQLQAGREEGTVSTMSVSIPFTMDQKGNAVFDPDKAADFTKSDEARSTLIK